MWSLLLSSISNSLKTVMKMKICINQLNKYELNWKRRICSINVLAWCDVFRRYIHINDLVYSFEFKNIRIFKYALVLIAAITLCYIVFIK